MFCYKWCYALGAIAPLELIEVGSLLLFLLFVVAFPRGRSCGSSFALFLALAVVRSSDSLYVPLCRVCAYMVVVVYTWYLHQLLDAWFVAVYTWYYCKLWNVLCGVWFAGAWCVHASCYVYIQM